MLNMPRRLYLMENPAGLGLQGSSLLIDNQPNGYSGESTTQLMGTGTFPIFQQAAQEKRQRRLRQSPCLSFQ
jgi:hypothetical protein